MLVGSRRWACSTMQTAILEDFSLGGGFLKAKIDKDVNDIKLKEVNNGRLAVMAIGGMVHHNLVVKGPLFPLFSEGWTGPQGP